MLSRAQLKMKAKEQLRGNWANAALATLILALVNIIIENFITPSIELNNVTVKTLTILFFSFCISTLFAIYSLLTQSFLYLKLTKDRKIKFSNLLISPRIFLKFILFNLLIMLVFMPLSFIVIGLGINFYQNFYFIYILIILVLSFFVIVQLYTSQVPFILVDNPKINFINAIKESFSLMKGNVITLLILNISFIGWNILNAFTGFIGSVFLLPYIFTTKANFYLELKKLKYNNSSEESSSNL